MHCAKCGFENEAPGAFCGNCGASLSVAPVRSVQSPVAAPFPIPPVAVPPAFPPAAAPPAYPPAAAPQPAKPGSSSRTWLIVALVVAIVVLSVGGTVLYLRWSDGVVAEQAAAAARASEEQLNVAAGWFRASLARDAATLKAFLPPQLVEKMPPDRLLGFTQDWSAVRRLAETGAMKDGALTVMFIPLDPGSGGAYVEQAAAFRVKSTSGDDALIDMEVVLTDTDEVVATGTVNLRRIEGTWRVARYVSGETDIVFWDAASTPAAVADALLADYPVLVAVTPPTTGMTPSTTTEFDIATATRVPAGQEPDDYVAAYYQAILDKEWETAFRMQPESAKSNGDPESFGATWESYGLVGFSIDSDRIAGSERSIVVKMDLGPNGIWNSTWVFYDDYGTWLVKERTKISMGEPR